MLKRPAQRRQAPNNLHPPSTTGIARVRAECRINWGTLITSSSSWRLQAPLRTCQPRRPHWRRCQSQVPKLSPTLRGVSHGHANGVSFCRASQIRPRSIYSKLHRCVLDSSRPWRAALARCSPTRPANLVALQGRTRFDRLLLIGKSCVPLRLEALKAAISEAKNGTDVSHYKQAWDCIRKVAPNEPEATRDDAWIDATEKSNKAETHRLESELKGYKHNLIKESIRVRHHIPQDQDRQKVIAGC